MKLNARPTDEVIARYLAGESLPSETEQVELWAESSPENKQDLAAFRMVWNESAVKSPVINTDAAWARVKTRIETNQKQVISIKRNSQKWVWLAAASVILIVALTFLLPKNDSIEYSEVFHSGNAQQELMLPDSSVVQLKPQSTLRWTKGFEGRERRLQLEGEARFSVRKNPSKPFIVACGDEYVRVLGTTFQVSHASGSDQTHVLVEEGKVLLSNTLTAEAKSDSSAVILLGGQSGWLKTGQKVKVSSIDPVQASFAFDKTLVFENTDLRAVCLILSEAFKKKIELSDAKLEQCRLTATFKQQELSEILQIIATTFNLNIIEQQGNTVLSGDGC